MPSSQSEALSRYRRRLKREGMVRLEVKVRMEDAELVRGVVASLSDPERRAEARALLQERFAAPPAKGLKGLLAAAPLDGIDLSRDRDTGRNLVL